MDISWFSGLVNLNSNSGYSASLKSDACLSSIGSIYNFHTTNELRNSLHRLMNLTAMTDPLNFCIFKCSHAVVYQYKSRLSGEIFIHTLPLRQLVALNSDAIENFEVLNELEVCSTNWKDLLYCR